MQQRETQISIPKDEWPFGLTKDNNQPTSTLSINLQMLRNALGLSQTDFAKLAKMSRTTLRNIESGNTNFKISTLNTILIITSIKLEDFSSVSFTPPKKLRNKLLIKYKAIPSIAVILSGAPSIPYCIKYKLLSTKFLTTPRETIHIIKFFYEKYGWVFKGNSLHGAIKRMPDLINIQPHPYKLGTNLYSKIKK